MANHFLLPALGFFITLYAVACGRGGGLLYVGVLTALLGVKPDAAVATSLAILFPTAVVGAWSHWRRGNVNPKMGGLLFISGALGAALGSSFGRLIPPLMFRKLLGAFLLWTLIAFCIAYFRKSRTSRPEKASSAVTDDPPKKTWKPMGYSFLGGIQSSMTGVSGSTPLISGLMSSGYTPIEITGSSLCGILGISTVGFLMHLQSGQIDWQITRFICMGTLAGSFIAPILQSKIPRSLFNQVGRPLFVVLVGWITIVMLLK